LLAAKNALKLLALVAVVAATPSAALAAGDFQLEPHWPYVGANVVLFLLLIPFVNRLMIQPMLHVLDEREARTTGALDRATALEAKTRETAAQIEARLAEARGRAQNRRASILAEAEAEERALLSAASDDAARSIESVRSAVEAELAQVRSALEADARTLAREAASRLLGRTL